MVTVVVGLGYLKSFPGGLKLTELIASLIALIIILVADPSSKATAFLVSVIGALIISIFFILLYLTKLIVKGSLPWFSLEMLISIIWFLFYTITSAIIIATLRDSYIAAGTFGLLACVAFLIDGVHKFMNR